MQKRKERKRGCAPLVGGAWVCGGAGCHGALHCTLHGAPESTGRVVQFAKAAIEGAANTHPNHPRFEVRIEREYDA